MQRQRIDYHKGRLAAKRWRALADLGFVWDVHEAFWEEQFRAFVAFRKRFGHGRVPQRWPENQELATWVANVRSRSDEVTPSQRLRLEEVGLVWNARADVWSQRLEELRAFERRSGHADVPARWPENRALGRWVAKQRALHRRGQLAADRVRHLERLGLGFDLTPPGWVYPRKRRS